MPGSQKIYSIEQRDYYHHTDETGTLTNQGLSNSLRDANKRAEEIMGRMGLQYEIYRDLGVNYMNGCYIAEVMTPYDDPWIIAVMVKEKNVQPGRSGGSRRGHSGDGGDDDGNDDGDDDVDEGGDESVRGSRNGHNTGAGRSTTRRSRTVAPYPQPFTSRRAHEGNNRAVRRATRQSRRAAPNAQPHTSRQAPDHNNPEPPGARPIIQEQQHPIPNPPHPTNPLQLSKQSSARSAHQPAYPALNSPSLQCPTDPSSKN